MGLGNRPYMGSHGNEGGGGGLLGGGGVGFGLPKPSTTVKWLLIANVGIFVIQLLGQGAIERVFAVTARNWWQVWRYLSFQFLHADFWHIALNMLGLYFLGTPLEQRWGRRRFLAFYLSCGAFAGVAYVVVMLATMGQAAWSVPLLGASGGVYGIILAAAVLFPHFRLIFLFFPVPIRLAALIIFGGMLFTVFAGLAGRGISPAFWSQVAHLGGTAVAAVWLWVVPRASGAISDGRQRIRWGTWQRRIEHQREEQMELDRILDKIHEQGITSLTRREKKILHDATRRQREQERELHRL